MRKLHLLSIVLSFLIVSLPVCFSTEINLVYDANGNLVTGDGLYREYNSLNQLWKVHNGSSVSGVVLENYTYHPIEERVWMKQVYNSSGGLVETVYYISEEFVRVVNSTGGTSNFAYIFHEGELVAQSNSVTTYVLGDHLGSSSVVTNSSGNVTESTQYNPWGEIISGGLSTRYDYTGQEFDSVIGDYDYHARRYKAEWGKFTKPDTLFSNVYNPQELNRYSYVNNNPYKYTDSSGHCIEDFCIVEITLVLAVYVVGTFSMAVSNAKVIEAEKTGNPEAIKKAKFEFYTTPITSSLGILFPESKVIDYYGLYSTGKDVFDAWNLINPPQSDISRITQTRDNIISSAISNYESGGHNFYSNGATTLNNDDKFGVGSLIQRWFQKNPEKKDDLKKQLSGGGNSGSPGKIVSKNEVKNPNNKKWTK